MGDGGVSSACEIGCGDRPAGGFSIQVGSPVPEIDCVRHLLADGVGTVAERRAFEIGTGADRVLINHGHLAEDTYAAALAASLGTRFEPLDNLARADCPLTDDQLIYAGRVGMLPILVHGFWVWVFAPHGVSARHLMTTVRAATYPEARIRFTSSARLMRFVTRHAMPALGQRAAEKLKAEQPDLSAATPTPRSLKLPVLWSAALIAALIFMPGPTITAIGLALAFVFLAWTALRIASALTPRRAGPRQLRTPDDQLPVYTIIVALYREATAAGNLVAALRAFDYPPEKLDIKLVLEADDTITRAAIERMQLGPPFEVLIAPSVGPRTKPKALNAALPFARGAFTAVYDAEDRPDPQQLRRALATFDAHGPDLACVQALLTIDNTADSLLARLFTAEYAGLFDVLLPALAARQLPLPLGGSSNHFRTEVLRRVGAWDPYNVTEDADLGMRLARRGYRSTTANSSTYEEAPARLHPWLKQRTRWFKGWMQTWLVHMRSPRRLARELGPAGFIVFQLMVGGSVLAPLVHPIFAVVVAADLISGRLWSHDDSVFGTVLCWINLTTLLSGYLGSVLLGYFGLARRGLRRTAWALLLMPLYWVLLSLAAWRALIQLISNPYHWEKTEHGLARTSRQRAFADADAAVVRAVRSRG